MRRILLLLVLALSACSHDEPSLTQPTRPTCNRGADQDGVAIPRCLLEEGTISAGLYASATVLVQSAVALRDSLRPLSSSYAVTMAPYINRSLQSLDDFYVREVLDSTLFNRSIDRIAVTLEYARGTLPSKGPVMRLPARTPRLIWLEPATTGGLYFQPVTTLFETGMYYSGATMPIDSLTRTATAFWNYATWVESKGEHFPVWQYIYHWNGAGVPVAAPSKSGLAQGLALAIFTQVYTRTQDTVWLSRAKAVAVSMTVTWNDGGVLIEDQTGAWWEEYHPVTRIWNGHVFALLGVGEYLKVVPSDTAMARLYPLGVKAALAYAKEYDSGSWLKYSRNEASITEPYRTLYVDLAQRIGLQTGDPAWHVLAAKWARYVRPAGASLPNVPPDLHAVLYPSPP